MMKRLSWIPTLVLALLVFVSPARALDHGVYDAILENYVSGGYFDYESFHENDDSRNQLNQYRYRMSRVNPDDLDEREALAYWINLYNAATLRLIMDNYPLKSIRDLGGWFTTPWERPILAVRGDRLTLDEVEHEIIRGTFEEPRIHFALVCAARSCPPLRSEAYRGERLDEQLEDQADRFMHSSMNEFRVRKNRLHMRLSRIFSWYAEDFGGLDGVARYAADFLDEEKRRLVRRGDYRLSFRSYDWSLNQSPGPYGVP